MFIDPDLQMWVTFALIVGALVLFALELAPMEVISIGIVCALLLFFHLYPVPDGFGGNRMDAAHILRGFANPALITVLSLLVIGQGLVRTGILDRGARFVLKAGGGSLFLSTTLVLVVVMVVSAFLNNIPVVVIFIPIMQALATRFGRSASKVMIPLSFAAVLGGMTTLVGSSTNLLVNSALIEMRLEPFGFFDFSVPGMVMAAAGLVYLMVAAPALLPDRETIAETLQGGGLQFIAQIPVTEESHLVGATAPVGVFTQLIDMTVRMVQRGEEAFMPPFEGVVLQPGDMVVVAATRSVLKKALETYPGLLYPDLRDGRVTHEDGGQPWHGDERVLAEVLVAPASRLIGRTLRQIAFHYKTRCIVLGIRRRSRMIRSRMTDIRLADGDVLLVQGQPDDVNALKLHRDVVLIESSAEELPVLARGSVAGLIFLAVILFAATGLVPIVVAALVGAAVMVATGVLNVSQAARAVDPKIVTTIGAALAMGAALQETGGAAFIAAGLVRTLMDFGPAIVLSAFFLVVAGLSNVVSTKATAVLFTPIAVDIARQLGVSPEAFAVAVVFAANCSFASPIGYQTNLLVLGPGAYRFLDFSRVGIPLMVFLWIVFTLFAPWWYGF